MVWCELEWTLTPKTTVQWHSQGVARATPNFGDHTPILKPQPHVVIPSNAHRTSTGHAVLANYAAVKSTKVL